MADDKIDSRESDEQLMEPGFEAEHATDGVVPGADQPGENLASTLLPDDVDYEVAADETEAEELDVDRPLDDDVVEDEAQLTDAEATAAAAVSTRPVKRRQRRAEAGLAEPEPLAPQPTPVVVSARPVRKSATVAKKDHATPRQVRRTGGEPASHRVGPGQFLREVGDELRKVVWPTGSQLWQYFVVVLLFVLFIIAFVSLLDLGFGWLLLKLLG